MEDKGQWGKYTVSELQEMLATASGQDIPRIIAGVEQDPRKGVRQMVQRYMCRMEKERAEEQRLHKMWERERTLCQAGYTSIAGIDEVGRGPLAGPVVAGCVILPLECSLPGLNDSKKVSPSERVILANMIKNKALAWGIGMVDHQEIDRINILEATKKAMLAAIANMMITPDYLLIDAVTIATTLPQEGIIGGDGLSASIAAASILAKTYRDALMDMLHELYPVYGFKEHKGYGTPRHLEVLDKMGPCPIHRLSFLSGRANLA